MNISDDRWNERVGTVFNTRPRVGHTKGTIWLERRKEQETLAGSLQRPGVHVCIDGPTGAGKSSLALTHLITHKIPHVPIQVTGEMSWVDFCRQIIRDPQDYETKLTAELELGIDRALPSGKLRISLGGKRKGSDDVRLQDSMANSWSEHDVAERLAEENATLLVDDLERASDPLVSRLSDLCKILTQSYVASNAKLMLVGTGDIYRRLYDANRSLEERLAEVSLGAFPTANYSWSFLALGFNKLKLWHPGVSRKPEQRKKTDVCIKAVYEAADGLPKSLNRLGQEIALKGRNRNSVTIYDITTECTKMARTHWEQHSREFPKIVEYLRQNDAAIEVIKLLYEEGMGRIHDSQHLANALIGTRTRRGRQLPAESIEEAIDGLVTLDFLIRTGVSGEVVFAAHPSLAHTLGVVMRSPARFRGAAALLDGLEQLTLPFPAVGVGAPPAEDATERGS